MSWNNSLWDCFTPLGTCCLASWCPCVIYGKTSARQKDPSKEDPSGCNGSCCGWCLLASCSLAGFLQCMRRGQIRNKYHIEGNLCTDFLASCCCTCCDLMQQEKEVKEKETLVPAGYQKPPQMMYQQPA